MTRDSSPGGAAPSEATLAQARLARRAEQAGRDRWAGATLAVLLLLSVALAGQRLWRVASAPPPPATGAPAPEFSVTTLDGAQLGLADLKGQVVLLDFWATWCPPCVASLPALGRLHEQFADRGFSVLGVNQEPEAVARVRGFVTARDLRFPVVVDPGEISEMYGVHTLPTSFLVDQDGVIRGAWRGLVSESRLEAAIEALLEPE